MFKVNNKEARTTSRVSLFLTFSLTLRILMSLLLTLNTFPILQDVKNAEIRALCWKKGSSNLSFVCINAQGVLKGFYGIGLKNVNIRLHSEAKRRCLFTSVKLRVVSNLRKN